MTETADRRPGTVFHVPEGDPAYGRRAFRNVENLLADETIDSDITVVCNGGGVDQLFASASAAERVRELVDAGVRVCACRNSLDDPDTSLLVEGVEIVPTAMGELTRRQAAGDAYVRP